MSSDKRDAIKASKSILRMARKDAKLIKKQNQKIAKAQIKEMRPYMKSLYAIDLRKEITSAQRSFITRAWNEYQELTARPFKVYRTKNKQRLKIAQEYARHEKGKPKFDVAFIPSADPKAKIKFSKTGMEISSKYVTEKFLFFDIKKLAENPEHEIMRALERNPTAKQFIIMAGKFLYNGGLPRSLVKDKVMNLMAQYSPGGQGYARRGENSHYSNWLFGLVSFEAKNQTSIDEYRKAYSKSRQGQLEKRRKERRARRRNYGQKF